MMFKKGSFEIGGVIYPVAIKVRLDSDLDKAKSLSVELEGILHEAVFRTT